MPHVDSLLALVHREGANELRLGTDRAPAMFATGAPKRLAIPNTSADTLRHLLGDLVSPAGEAELRAQRRLEVMHEVQGIGTFRMTVTPRGDAAQGIDVVFLLRSAPAVPAAAQLAPPPQVERPMAVAPRSSEGRDAGASAAEPRAPAVEGRTGGAERDGLRALLARAMAMHASDLHLAEREAPVVRVDGRLVQLFDHGPVDVEALLQGALDDRGRDRLTAGASVDFALEVPLASDPHDSIARQPPRVRGNAYPTSRGLAAAFRMLPPEPPRLDTLAFPVPIGDLALLPNGLVVVSGPTGSGKSTTIAAIAQEALTRRSIVLVSLEDPIEYHLSPPVRAARGLSLVRQRQIGRDARDFATGLRDALREDPDVILVGEMRDEESISLALTAAETGHLVLTTLHSRSAASAIERIVDACPQGRQTQIRTQLADSLRAIVSQRLVPRASGDGRALAAEVLRGTPSIANGLREGKLANVLSSMQAGRRDGMITLERSLADLVRRGEISDAAARSAANDVDALATYLRGPG